MRKTLPNRPQWPGSRRPVALDLFCGGGGASIGLYMAGFDVVGYDIKRSRSYPFTQFQWDLSQELHLPTGADFVWASPPCQRWARSTLSAMERLRRHPDLIGKIRGDLQAYGAPYAIENVALAPIRQDLILTGPDVGLYQIYRRRAFELSFFTLAAKPKPYPRADFDAGKILTITKSLSTGKQSASRRKIGLPCSIPKETALKAMGIPITMTYREIGEAVPPAYAMYIGQAAIQHLQLQH